MNDYLVDSYNRKIDYLRLSVTDRCNLKCLYCMPKDGIKLYKRNEVLSYEEIIKLVKILAELGIKKIRITGGEPLVRKNLISLIKSLKEINSIDEISITTNGIYLSKIVDKLKMLGIERINISLDTLDANKYAEITRGGTLKKVLNSLDKALSIGIGNIKINVVITNFLDERDIRGFVSMACNKSVHVRFIEVMQGPFLPENSFNVECSSLSAFKLKGRVENLSINGGNEVFKKIFNVMREFGKFNRINKSLGFGPAVYYTAEGYSGSIGFILNDNVYCSACNRLRLNSGGNLQLCLFSDLKLDLKSLIRQKKAEENIKTQIINFVKTKPKNREASCRFKNNIDGEKNSDINENVKHKDNNSKFLNYRLNEFMSKIGG